MPRSRGLTVLEARGVAHGKTMPMLPMLELWRAFYQLGEDDSPEVARAKISGTLLRMDESYREDLPVIYDLFGVPDPANPSPPADPEQRQKRLHGVLKRVMHDPAFRQRGPRVILLEDLHWFDGASNAFLETIVELHARDALAVAAEFSPRLPGAVDAPFPLSACVSAAAGRRTRFADCCAIIWVRIPASPRCPR